MAYNYYKLLDLQHLNAVIRTKGPIHEEYVKSKGWVRSGLLMEYLCDESDYYELYEEITDDEAKKLIEEVE